MPDMDSAVFQRIEVLKAEFEKGRRQMQALDAQRAEVRDTLLRIRGALQVLAEIATEQRRGDLQGSVARSGDGHG